MTRNEAQQRPKTTGEGRLPGDPTAPETVAAMIRVDHAGEYGAVRIYEGQLAILGDTEAGDVIRKMAEQEREHLENFDRLIGDRRVRPTVLAPLWHAAGFALGVGTALLGPRSAMACTQAVEEVIQEHYADQADRLGDDEAALRDLIETYRADEIRHRDTAVAHDAEKALAYGLLTGAVKAGSRLAIWLSTRI